MTRHIGFVLLIATSLAIPLAADAQVSVNVNVGPPPVIFPAPPRVVLVPQTPVYYAPDTSYNVFFYQGATGASTKARGSSRARTEAHGHSFPSRRFRRLSCRCR